MKLRNYIPVQVRCQSRRNEETKVKERGRMAEDLVPFFKFHYLARQIKNIEKNYFFTVRKNCKHPIKTLHTSNQNFIYLFSKLITRHYCL